MSAQPGDAAGLIGRGAELAALRAVLARARGGEPALVVVHGPAGVGTSALVDAALAEEPVPRVIRRAAVHWESSLLAGIAAGAPHPDPATDPDAAAAWLAARCAEPAADGPVAHVVEDAQHADTASLRALSSAVRRLAAPVLVVLVASGDPERWPVGLAEVRAAHADTAIAVPGLGPADVASLAASRGRAIGGYGAGRLARHTAGCPGPIIELLDSRHSLWDDPRVPLPAPRSVVAAFRRALAGEPAEVTELAEAAATLCAVGRSTSGDELAMLLAAAGSGAAAALLPTIDRAVGAGILCPHVDGRIEFASPLGLAAVRDRVPLTRRVRWHRQAGGVLGADRGLLHRVLATVGRDDELAASVIRRAEQLALAGAWSDAAEMLIMVSRIAGDPAECLLRAVDALVSAGDLPAAAALSPEIEGFTPVARRDAVIGYLTALQGRAREAELLYERAWSGSAGTVGADAATAALISQRRALHALCDWRPEELVAWSERALEFGGATASAVIETKVLYGLGHLGAGRLAEAEEAYAQVMAEIPDGAQAQRARMGRGWLRMTQDAHEEARQDLERALAIRTWGGSARISLWAHGWLARVLYELGEWDAALETVERRVPLLQRSGLDLQAPLLHWSAARVHALRGATERAERHLRAAGSVPREYACALIPAALARAQVAEVRGDHPGVLRALEPVAELAGRRDIDEPGCWPWQHAWASALVATGELERADVFLRPHEERAAARGHRTSLGRLGEVRGRWLAARGRLDEARAAHAAALGQLDQLTRPVLRASISLSLGQMLRRAGKRKEAVGALGEARELYAGLAAQPMLLRTDRELRAAGLGTRRPLVLAALTPQERTVAGLVASGATNREASEELFVSVKTVEYHLTRIYTKLGLRGRAELAAHYSEADG